MNRLLFLFIGLIFLAPATTASARSVKELEGKTFVSGSILDGTYPDRLRSVYPCTTVNGVKHCADELGNFSEDMHQRKLNERKQAYDAGRKHCYTNIPEVMYMCNELGENPFQYDRD